MKEQRVKSETVKAIMISVMAASRYEDGKALAKLAQDLMEGLDNVYIPISKEERKLRENVRLGGEIRDLELLGKVGKLDESK